MIPSATSHYANSMVVTVCATLVFAPPISEETVFATSAAQALDASTTLAIAAMWVYALMTCAIIHNATRCATTQLVVSMAENAQILRPIQHQLSIRMLRLQ